MTKFSSIEVIPFSIDAGEKLIIPAANWEFLQINDLTPGAILIAAGTTFRMPLIVGRAVRFREPENGRVELYNKGSGTISGELYVGSGDISDSTIVGTVSVTNSAKTRTEQGIAHLKGATMAAKAAEYGYSYLANPAASEKNLIVNLLAIPVDSAGTSGFGLFSTSDYLAMEADAGFTFAVSAASDSNKKVGGDDGAALIRSGSCTGLNPVTLAGSGPIYQGLNRTLMYVFTEPFIVSPGMALGVRTLAVNEIARVNFEWFEEVA